ncbi:interferon regulatory factor 2-like [Brienomyrus brachyistius]|uniref:interferon regulatory factor 2-like n=1 Tax=Brienomyrus brachyistius TaxID=42636 RepID=UPI0020B3CAB4|nr:interferon regulatory factor 2-like [Brienomyrus brachyistius]
MPVERMRMRPWLEEQINSSKIPGLKWVNREKKIFQIPWMHAARHGWDMEKDAPLFRNWAIHTGKYQPGVDKADPKTWKANFRCAMNSLPDIEEVKDKSIKKGTNAFRVYKMLMPTERRTKKGKKRTEKEEKIKAGCQSMWAEQISSAHMFSLAVKADNMQDSLALTDRTCPASHSLEEEQMTVGDLPDVCQTIEVTAEEEDQSVSSSQMYPLQISPVSSCAESEIESIQSEVDTKEGGCGMWVDGKPLFSTSEVKTPTCSLPSMATFVTSGKSNLSKVSSSGEEPLLLSYDYTPWNVQPVQVAPFPTTSSSASVSESRASVIMKTSDISKTTVKTC